MELRKRAQGGWATLCRLSQQREESTDVIVPDVSPDVFTVLSVTAACTLRETTLREGHAELAGSAEVLVLYTSEEEKVCTLRASLPFRHGLEAAGCGEKCAAQARVEAAAAQAAVLNPRKLSLRVTLAEELEAWQERPFELCEGLDGAAEEGLQCRRQELTCTTLAAVAVKQVNFTEDLRLRGEAAAGGLLLRTAAEWQIEETRVMANKLLVRGTAAVQAVTVTDGGAFAGSCTYSLPFSQMIECDGAAPEDRAEITAVTEGLECLLSPGEDGPRLSLNLTGTLAARLWREQTLQAVTDFFSTRCASDFERAPVAAELRPEEIEARGEVSEPLEGAPAQVCDWSCCTGAERLPDGGQLCRYWFRILGRAEDGTLRTVTHRCEVRTELENVLACAARAENVRFAPADGGLTLAFTAVAAGLRAPERTLSQITAGRLDPQQPRRGPEPGTLLLRAVGTEESVWSIAKQYGVPPELLRTANKLAPDAALTPGQLVIVPFAG